MNKWILFLGANLFIETISFAGTMGDSNQYDLIHDGLFVGLGGNYNSISISQHSYGLGISNVQTDTGDNSNGIASGYGAPFRNTNQSFSPEIQTGYFKHLADDEHVYGFKFSYQYLGATATNSNLYIPQQGQITSKTGITSSLYGYAIAQSVEVTTSHELNLLAFIGRSYGNKYFYLGAGPSLYNLKSQNYNSIGYAEYSGVTIDVTGLVNYSSPSIWAWGGAAQLGINYFISPTWFLDASYTYSITGKNSTNYQQAFYNKSQIATIQYVTSGTIFTTQNLRLVNQAFKLSINKVLDF